MKTWTIALAALIVGFFTLIIRPVPTATEENCLTVTGTVESIRKTGTLDAIFRLQGYDRMFYINRGLERGLDLKDLQNQLTGHTVTIKYPEYWTPLDPVNSTRHIVQLEYDNKVIYSELIQK